MLIQNVQQGTKEWLALRATKFTASEAPAMMGVSKYMKRSELLEQKYTGVIPEVTPAQQKIFDRGHAAEESARFIAEEIIGDELYPSVALSAEYQELLASFDGIDMLETVIFEHKLINSELRTVTEETLPEQYKVQMDQQLLVSGAEKALFMASDGTKDDCNWFWYERDEKRLKAIVDGWKQFEDDLENYQPKQKTVEAVGTAPDSLPALSIQLSGGVTNSNLPAFKEAATKLIQGIKTELSTDQDFADADSSVKWLKKGEQQLERAKENALQQTITISELFTTVDDLKEQMRQKRLYLEKLVKAEKENRRNDIRAKAQESFTEWLTAQKSPVFFNVDIDIAGAMKGLKTISSLQSAADDEVARAKIEATRTIESIKSNEKLLAEQGKDYEFLFSDSESLLLKSPDDLAATIKARIADHKEREEQRLQAERERIQREEERKAFASALESQEEDTSGEPVGMKAGIDVSRIKAAAQRYEQQKADTVTISRKEYEELIDDRNWRLAMENAGVDNWSGYDFAMEELQRIEDEQAA